MNKMFDIQHPFFKPIWRRVLLVVACLGWAAFELSHNAYFWALLFLAFALHVVIQLFFLPWPDESKEEDIQDDSQPEG